MPERIIQQFKKLKEVEPEQEWLNLTRQFLVNKVEKESLTYQTPWNYNFKVLLFNWQKKIALAPVRAASLIIVISLIFGTGFIAQAEKRPSAFLYKVNEFTSDFYIVLMTSQPQKAKAYLKRAEKRSNDALELVKSETLSQEDKEKDMNTLVTKLRQDVISANVSLDIVEQTQENNEKVADLAKVITENTKDTVEVLNQVITETARQGFDNEKVTKAIGATEDVGDNAIQLLVKKQQTGEVSQEEFSELKTLIENKIKLIEEKVEKIADEIDTIETQDFASLQQANIVDLDNTLATNDQEATISEDLLKQEEIEDLKAKLQEAEDYLAEARNLLETDALTEALDKIKAGSQLINQINEALTEITKSESDGELIIEVNQGEATSTEELLEVEGAIEVIEGVFGDNTTTTETTVKVIGDEVITTTNYE